MEPAQAPFEHGKAAREFAEALLESDEDREALFSLLRHHTLKGLAVDPEVFVTFVEKYQRSSARLCRAKDDLDEVKSLDPRVVCERCFVRLWPHERERCTCPATGYQKPHQIEESK